MSLGPFWFVLVISAASFVAGVLLSKQVKGIFSKS